MEIYIKMLLRIFFVIVYFLYVRASQDEQNDQVFSKKRSFESIEKLQNYENNELYGDNYEQDGNVNIKRTNSLDSLWSSLSSIVSLPSTVSSSSPLSFLYEDCEDDDYTVLFDNQVKQNNRVVAMSVQNPVALHSNINNQGFNFKVESIAVQALLNDVVRLRVDSQESSLSNLGKRWKSSSKKCFNSQAFYAYLYHQKIKDEQYSVFIKAFLECEFAQIRKILISRIPCMYLDKQICSLGIITDKNDNRLNFPMYLVGKNIQALRPILYDAYVNFNNRELCSDHLHSSADKQSQGFFIRLFLLEKDIICDDALNKMDLYENYWRRGYEYERDIKKNLTKNGRVHAENSLKNIKAIIDNFDQVI